MIPEAVPETWKQALANLGALIRDQYVKVDQAAPLSEAVLALRDRTDWLGENDDGHAWGLTLKLRELTRDWHFSVVMQHLSDEQRAAPAKDRWKLLMGSPPENLGFESVAVRDGVAIVSITSLIPLEWSRGAAAAALEACRDARAVIFDLRRCGGGDPDLIAWIASYFTGEDAQELSCVEWRDGEREELWTNPSSPAFRFAQDVPLVFLVGAATASGAEALAYDLQASRRAKVVGAQTLGAAHRIKTFEIGEGMVASIPSGKVTNPSTGSDWQGRGVVPNVVVKDGEDAPTVARRVALESC